MNVFIFSACKSIPGNAEVEVLYSGPDAVEGLKAAVEKANGRRIYKLVNPLWIPVSLPAPKATPPRAQQAAEKPKEQPTLRAPLKKL